MVKQGWSGPPILVSSQRDSASTLRYRGAGARIVPVEGDESAIGPEPRTWLWWLEHRPHSDMCPSLHALFDSREQHRPVRDAS